MAFFLSRSKQGRPFEESAADQRAARERAMRAAAEASAARDRGIRAAAAGGAAPAAPTPPRGGGDDQTVGAAAAPALSKPAAAAAPAAPATPVETADTATVDIMAKTSVADGPFKAPRVFHDPDFGPIEIHFGCLPSGDVELPSDDERGGDGLGDDDDDGGGTPRYVTASGAHDSGRGPLSAAARRAGSASEGGEEKHAGRSGQAVAVSTGVTGRAAGPAVSSGSTSTAITTARIGGLQMQPAVTHFRMNVSVPANASQPVSTSTSTPASRRGLVTTSGRVGVLPPKSGRGGGNGGNGGSFGPTTLHGRRVVKHGGGRGANMRVSPAPSQGETLDTLIKPEYKPPSQRSPLPDAAAPAVDNLMVGGVLRVWDTAAAEEKTDGDGAAAAAAPRQVFVPVQTIADEMAQLTALRRDKPEAARKLMTRGALLVDLACGGGSSLAAFCAVVDKCRPGEFLQWHVDKALVGAALGGHADILRAMVSLGGDDARSVFAHLARSTSPPPHCSPPLLPLTWIHAPTVRSRRATLRGRWPRQDQGTGPAPAVLPGGPRGRAADGRGGAVPGAGAWRKRRRVLGRRRVSDAAARGVRAAGLRHGGTARRARRRGQLGVGRRRGPAGHRARARGRGGARGGRAAARGAHAQRGRGAAGRRQRRGAGGGGVRGAGGVVGERGAGQGCGKADRGAAETERRTADVAAEQQLTCSRKS